MRFHLAPTPLLTLITAILLTPTHTAARPPLELGVAFADLFARDTCAGTLCGWNSQLCCSAGSACITDSNNQAQCTSSAASYATTTDANGYWQYYTTTYVQTDLATVTSVGSSWMGAGVAATTAAAAAPSATAAQCNYALNETPCGSICCASDQYCYASGQCNAAANGGSSGYYSSYYSTMYATTNSAGVPLRPTSSTLVIVTATSSPTATVPFETPVATGANITLTSDQAQHSGLSGGAIAGIVIGVLLGLLLLGLLLFYCCLRGLWAGFAALFGGNKKRRTVEVDTYERYSHHSGNQGGREGRTWFGGGAAGRPTRVERREEKHEGGKKLLGVGAGLAALWAVLGLKRRNQQRRQEEKYGSEYSYYSSDYYTSESSASSDDRRTRDTRRSQSRR